jgi:DNA (cytosine-5)-methyltransferase 1
MGETMIRQRDVEGVAILEPTSAGRERPGGSVVDLFCGAGGLTHGFRKEGCAVAAGIDIDEDCRFAYEHNNHAPFIRKDIDNLFPSELNGLFYPGEPRILVGCAPCQPFLTYNQKNEDPKWQLIAKFGELIAITLPDVVSMENVPRLLDFRGGAVFSAFEAVLREADYHVHHEIAYAPDFGVPRKRYRLVLLASRRGPITLDRSVGANQPIDVGHAIGALPPLEAGGIDGSDPMQSESSLRS